MVATWVKQLEKELERGKVICTKMVEKEIDKSSQVDESQMSLVIIMAMSWARKEWEKNVDQFLVAVKTTQEWQNQQQKRCNQQLEENMKMKKQIEELQKEIKDWCAQIKVDL
jgi:esterase/lipase